MRGSVVQNAEHELSSRYTDVDSAYGDVRDCDDLGVGHGGGGALRW